MPERGRTLHLCVLNNFRNADTGKGAVYRYMGIIKLKFNAPNTYDCLYGYLHIFHNHNDHKHDEMWCDINDIWQDYFIYHHSWMTLKLLSYNTQISFNLVIMCAPILCQAK